jgi:hypothetical protein
MHPLCVVRHRVAISKLIDATTPGESRSNLAPPLKTPKQLAPSLTPIRAVLHRAACWEFFARQNFVKYPNLLRWGWGFQHQLNSRTVLFVFGASVSSADASTQSSVFWSYSPSTGIPSATPRVISLFIWLPYVWTYLSTSDTEGYLRLRSRANPMHTSEEVSSFTIIENAMLESNKSSIQHYYNRTKLCCFAFIYWSKFIPTF